MHAFYTPTHELKVFLEEEDVRNVIGGESVSSKVLFSDAWLNPQFRQSRECSQNYGVALITLAPDLQHPIPNLELNPNSRNGDKEYNFSLSASACEKLLSGHPLTNTYLGRAYGVFHADILRRINSFT